jgi:hypothetical protein
MISSYQDGSHVSGITLEEEVCWTVNMPV